MGEGLGEWDNEPDNTTDAAEAAEPAPELFYPNVAAFVAYKLAVTYRRQLNAQGGVT